MDIEIVFSNNQNLNKIGIRLNLKKQNEILIENELRKFGKHIGSHHIYQSSRLIYLLESVDEPAAILLK